ncbi:MAG: hypothetical protein ACJAT5_000079 [Lentimonas sp.]|jgi:hypothetical protein
MIRSIGKRSLVVLFVLLALAGCDAPNVEIIISPEYQSATIQIDFVKVQRSEVPIWMGMSVDDYFSPGSQFRDFAKQRGDIYTVYYNVPGKAFQGTIPSDDSVWENFEYERGSEQSFDVIILADLPGAYGGLPVDIRRKIIPLEKKSWSISFLDKVFGKGLEKLAISITSGGILLDPPPVED